MEYSVKIMIVEDEMIIAAKVALFLTELGYDVSAILPGADEALAHVAQSVPDLALLDIQLQGTVDGINLAHKLHAKYQLPVVFLTANADDATFERAKSAKPFAFLQKPFRKMELKRTLELAIARMAGHEDETDSQNTNDGFCLDDRIFVRHNDKMVKIMFADILHVAADRSYCQIVTTEKEYLLTMPMKRLEDRLPPASFQRIHRSHIVNLQRVEAVSDGMVNIGKEQLPLSPAMKGDFMRRLNAF
ncbi:MAG TPA: response regulator [Cryomorphaceae bacterium]|nr:response regulator [Cryomorphaceae bacterium]